MNFIQKFNAQRNNMRAARHFFAHQNLLLPPVLCADGFIISIQADCFHYCQPRGNFDDYSMYITFECGYPNRIDDLLLPYALNSKKPLETVYGYVPKEVIEKVLDNHGGMVGFMSWQK